MVNNIDQFFQKLQSYYTLKLINTNRHNYAFMYLSNTMTDNLPNTLISIFDLQQISNSHVIEIFNFLN